MRKRPQTRGKGRTGPAGTDGKKGQNRPASKTAPGTPADAATPHLIFRTRRTGDIILCDYCQNYKCEWLDFSPANYPKSCPATRRFCLSDGRMPEGKIRQRAATAGKVGLYVSFSKGWYLDAMMAKRLTADALRWIMDEINTWSPRNRFSLSGMVEYIPGKGPRAAVQEKLEAAGRKKD